MKGTIVRSCRPRSAIALSWMAVATLTMESGPGSCRSTCRRRYTPYARAMTLLRSTIHNRSVSRGPNCGKEIVASLIAPPITSYRRRARTPGWCSLSHYRGRGSGVSNCEMAGLTPDPRPRLLSAYGGRLGVESVHRRLQPFSYDRLDCPPGPL